MAILLTICRLYRSQSSVQYHVNPAVKKKKKKTELFFGRAANGRGLPLAVPMSVRGFQVLLTAVSHGQLVRTSLFWLYLAVGGDFSLVIESLSRWAVLKRAPLLNCHTASGSMNR